MSGHRFCRKHSSHFCPCVAPWLYGAAAKAAYEHDFKYDRSAVRHERDEAGYGRREDDQLMVAPEDGESLR
jgi:hypothetical protein